MLHVVFSFSCSGSPFDSTHHLLSIHDTVGVRAPPGVLCARQADDDARGLLHRYFQSVVRAASDPRVSTKPKRLWEVSMKAGWCVLSETYKGRGQLKRTDRHDELDRSLSTWAEKRNAFERVRFVDGHQAQIYTTLQELFVVASYKRRNG